MVYRSGMVVYHCSSVPRRECDRPTDTCLHMQLSTIEKLFFFVPCQGGAGFRTSIQTLHTTHAASVVTSIESSSRVPRYVLPPPYHPTMAQKMDRGSDACKAHLGGTNAMEIRQTRRGCLQELCCPCEARSEFKYYVGNNHVATSLEDSSCLCRWCCKPCRP